MGYSEEPTAHKILVVKTHALGDVLMTTPSLRSIRQAYPRATIDFLTGLWSAPVLAGNPNIDHLISFDDSILHKKKLWPLWSLVRGLKKNGYDLAFVFQPSPLIHHMIRFCGVKHIAAPVGKKTSKVITFSSSWRQNRNRYVVEDFADVVRATGIQVSDLSLDYVVGEQDLANAIKLLGDVGLADRRYLLVFPGGGRNPRDYVAQKSWPIENFERVIKKAKIDGIPVVLGGNQQDAILTKQLEISCDVVSFAGRTSLGTMAALIDKAALVLTNDSAPMHLALALKTPFVGIFGPSRRNALLPAEGDFITVEADFPCAPCYDNQPFTQCGRMDCIRSVRIDRVAEAVNKLWGAKEVVRKQND